MVPLGPFSHVFKIGSNTFSIIIRSPNNYAVTTITGVTVIGTMERPMVPPGPLSHVFKIGLASR